MPTAAQPKHRQVFQSLVKEIHSGRLKRGDRLPSEAELVRTYGASRITVGRAVRDLQAQGLVERRVGSGTYVSARQAPGALSFGLLIPELGETDIFEPVCQGMMASPLARNHALVWGSVSGEALSREDRAWQLCEQYIERRVSGVFFAPLEFTAPELDINQRIAAALDAARIPVVLLDRTVTPYPHRGHHDLVGIDNRRAGFIVTSHVLRLGSRRVAFAAQPDAAATVDAREAGYREALFVADLPVDRQLIRRFDPTDDSAVRSLMQASPDAIVCANDRTAARLMHYAHQPRACHSWRCAVDRHRRRRVRGAAAGAVDNLAAAVAADRRRGARGDAGTRRPPEASGARHPARRRTGGATIVRREVTE